MIKQDITTAQQEALLPSPVGVEPPGTVLLPAAFGLASYRLTLEALDSLDLPPFKGSALRGGFGHTFKRLVCFQPGACVERCQLGNGCPYGYVFETSPPAGSEALRNLDEVPRPFIIEPPTDRRTLIKPGELLSFGLTLIGQGMNYLPYFIAVFRELGRVGLGRTQGRYRLKSVKAILPYTGRVEAIYQASDEVIRMVETVVSSQAVMAQAAALPGDQLSLRFVTPTRLKHGGQWTEQGPPFQVLVKALLGRISSLSYFHCGQRLEVDFRGLIDRAAGVRISHSETHWEDWSRVSGRQQQRVEMGGLVGLVMYEGDLTDYLPLLALGELIHVGKGTVFGNGQYQIVR